MDNYNIFHFPFKWRYYLSHPIRFFKTLWNMLKNAKTRIVKGYCHWDVMDMDDWLLHVIPHMLRDMAKEDGYPVCDEFSSQQAWQTWLNNLAAKFESASADSPSSPQNEYQEEWYALVEWNSHKNNNITVTFDYDTSSEHYDIVRKQYFKREREIYEERLRIVREAFAELTRAEHFFSLWV